MANKWINNLIPITQINEEMKLISGSKTDYITPTGVVYKKSKNDLYYKKKNTINNHNKYVYCGITFPEGNKSRRVHRLIAEAFIPNPDNLAVVGHMDNNKQNYHIDNLYWTTTQDNTQKAIDDNLQTYESGIDNETSHPLKVVDHSGKIVAVYGSLSEAARQITNLSKSYLYRILKNNGDYKLRGKLYKYIPISKSEYCEFPEAYKNKRLVENHLDKTPKIFKAVNVYNSVELVYDNQTQFAKDFSLDQALISEAIRCNSIYGGWKFELIDTTKYKDSSGYKNLINTIDDVTIINIRSNEVKTFKTKRDLKNYLGLRGNDLDVSSIILNEWKVVHNN